MGCVRLMCIMLFLCVVRFGLGRYFVGLVLSCLRNMFLWVIFFSVWWFVEYEMVMVIG